MPTRKQLRAARACRCVRDRQEQMHETASKAYGRLCLRLPFLLRSSGLCQTLAFFDAKAKLGTKKEKVEYVAAIEDLATVIGVDMPTLRRRAFEDGVGAYCHLIRDAMEASGFLKRYAEAILRVDPTEDTEIVPEAEAGPTAQDAGAKNEHA